MSRQPWPGIRRPRMKHSAIRNRWAALAARSRWAAAAARPALSGVGRTLALGRGGGAAGPGSAWPVTPEVIDSGRDGRDADDPRGR